MITYIIHRNKTMKLKRLPFFALVLIANLGFSQAATACGSKDPVCDCTKPSKTGGKDFRKVDCSERGLTAMPNGIPNEVEHLNLAGNSLQAVPKSKLKKLKNIQQLDLTDNQITSINPDDFKDLKELTHIILSGNQITSINKDAFTGLTKLQAIQLDHIELNCGCDERDFYIWTLNYKPKPILIGEPMCSNEPGSSLKDIPVDSQIYSKCKNTPKEENTACAGTSPVCNCFSTKVICADKNLNVFPKGIPTTTTDLNLGSNKITILPDDGLKDLVNLKTLNLSNNLIIDIKARAFRGLSALETLQLQKNKIRTIEWQFQVQLPKLTRVDLNDNPLICGCKDKTFLESLKKDSAASSTFVGTPACENVSPSTHLKDLNLDAPPFDKCGGTTTTTTVRPSHSPPPQCMQCIKANALTEDECDANGNFGKCSLDEKRCKMDFIFKKNGSWSLQKLCSSDECTTGQPTPCVGDKSSFFDTAGTCSTCCGGDKCNEKYEEMKEFLKSIVFTIKLKMKDANKAEPSAVKAAITKVTKEANVPGVIQGVAFKIIGSEGYTEINATFLRGNMNKTQNALEVAVLEGIESDAVLAKEISPGEISIWTPEYCPPEKTIDELKGNYSWPATKQSGKAMLLCQNGIERMAIRKCVFGMSTTGILLIPEWDDPNLSDCAYLSKTTEALNTLTKIPITNGTVKAVSKQLATVSASAKNTADVSISADVLTKIVESDAAFYKENQNITTKDTVTTISNLLNVDFKTMQGAGSARSLISSIGALIKKIKLDGGQEMGAIENNLALTILDTTTGKADNGLQYGVTADPGYPEFNNTNVGMGKRGASTKTSIELPAGIFKNKGIKKAAFVGYKSDMLFKVMESDSASNKGVVADDSKKFNTTSNSMVLAATLDQPVTDLTGNDLIGIMFEHTLKDRANNPKCAWWDQAFNNGNGTWSTTGCKLDATSDGVTTCKCDHLTNFALLMDVYGSNSDLNADHQWALTIISITGCTLSAVALIFTIFTYAYFHRKLLKDNPSKILLNLCAALLGLNLVFLGGTHYQVDDGACKAVAVLLHYFLIAGFTWMGVEAFYMYLALIRVFQPYFSKLILKCCLIGWGLPLVIVVITIGVNKTDNYYLKGGQICWLRNIPFYGAIVAPVCLILIMNIVAFIMVVTQLRRLTLRKKLTKTATAHTSTVTQLRGSVSVLVLLGLTWLFAFLSIGDASLAFSYIFAILNTLQGLWIFIFYCLLKKDVQNAWMRKLVCCPTPEDSRSSKDQMNDINKIMNDAGKYTLNQANTSKKSSKESEGSRKQSDSTGVTFIASYKRVSTDSPPPLALFTPAHIKSGMPGVSPCGPFPSTELYNYERKDSKFIYNANRSSAEKNGIYTPRHGSSTATSSTRLSSAASRKSKKSVASNCTVVTNLSTENDDDAKPTDDNSNTKAYENPAFSRSISNSTSEPITTEPTKEQDSEEQPNGDTQDSKDEKIYKWEVKTPTGFVDSRGFARPT